MKQLNNFIVEKLRLNKSTDVHNKESNLTIDDIVSEISNSEMLYDKQEHGTRYIKYAVNIDFIKKMDMIFKNLKGDTKSYNELINDIADIFNLQEYIKLILMEGATNNDFLLNINRYCVLTITYYGKSFDKLDNKFNNKFIIKYNKNYESIGLKEENLLHIAAYLLQYIIDY